MPDFGAISDLFSNLKSALGVVSGFAGSLADPFDGNAAVKGSIESLSAE